MRKRLSGLRWNRAGRDLVAAADRLRDQRDWVRAAAAYRLAVDAYPTAADLHVQLGHALKESGDPVAAEAAYRTALHLTPQDADISLQLGHLFNRRGDVQAACTWYAAAAELAPDDADIARHLANAQAQLQDQSSEHLVTQGLLALQSRQFEMAAALFEEAVGRHNRIDISALLGHALKENGDYAAAHAAYQKYRKYALTKEWFVLHDAELQIGHLCKIQLKIRKALEHYILAKQIFVNNINNTSRHAKIIEIDREISLCKDIIFPVLRPK